MSYWCWPLEYGLEEGDTKIVYNIVCFLDCKLFLSTNAVTRRVCYFICNYPIFMFGSFNQYEKIIKFSVRKLPVIRR